MTESDLFRQYEWHCRRGMKEVEVVLYDYLHHCYRGDTPAHQALFARLLECQDADMFEWFTGRGEPEDEEMAAYVRHVLEQLAARHRG